MANEVVVKLIEKTELDGMRSESCAAIERAKQLAREIKDGVSLDSAAKMMLEAKSRVKNIIERLSEPKRNARAAWQGWLDLETELCEPYRRIEVEILKPAMSRFVAEEEAKRRIEENRLRAEAKKREEDERIQAAAEHEQRGDTEAAEVVLNHAVPIAPVVVPKMEQPKGVSYRTIWKFRIVDPALVPAEYKVVDEMKVGAVVRALKDQTKIAGIEVYSEQSIAGRV